MEQSQYWSERIAPLCFTALLFTSPDYWILKWMRYFDYFKENEKEKE